MTDYYELKLDPAGVRPDWLADDDRFTPVGMGGNVWSIDYTADGIPDWAYLSAIRIPADHWAVPALKQGFKPWPGGESAPSDWDGGHVLRRGGSPIRPGSWVASYESNSRWFWEDGAMSENDIIGYRTKPSEPKWPANATPELVEVLKHVKAGRNTGVLMQEKAAKLLAELEPVDPLLGVVEEAIAGSAKQGAANLRAELAKRGLAIVELSKSGESA